MLDAEPLSVPVGARVEGVDLRTTSLGERRFC
jgi:hypothetical protein